MTVTVDPAPSLQGANLAVALSSPGPLVVGTPETLTATLTDAQSHPIGNFVVQLTVTGANPTVTTLATNAAGVATFTYAGAVAGTDTAAGDRDRRHRPAPFVNARDHLDGRAAGRQHRRPGLDRRARDADDDHGPGAHHRRGGRDSRVRHAQLLAGDKARRTRTS